ncbi:MAG: ribosomal protein [Conexibacter sp.]|nr:ribosomal protein [Conexibacter sp.]
MADENDKNETPETPEPEVVETTVPEAAVEPTPEPVLAEDADVAVEETPAEVLADDADVDAAASEADATAAPARPRRSRTRRAATDEGAADDAATDEAPAEEPRRSRARRADSAETAKSAAQPKAAERAARNGDAAPVVRAQAKYVRSSARKARLVCDHIRGKSVEEARAILAFTPRAVARDWSKLLESAVANAEHNHELDGDELLIKAAHADEGPTLKRFRPRAMGRATQIRKRTSHLTILLTPKE